MDSRVKLKRYSSENIKETIKLIDKNIIKWIEPLRDPIDESQIIDWIKEINRKGEFFIISDKKRIVGTIWFENLNKKESSAEVGFIIGAQFQGEGYAKEAIDLILNYGFNRLKLKKIIGLTNNFNLSSQKVMESRGFTLVKIIKKDYQEKGNGRWCDVLIYEKIK